MEENFGLIHYEDLAGGYILIIENSENIINNNLDLLNDLYKKEIFSESALEAVKK